MAAPEPEIQEFVKRMTLGTRSGKVNWTADTDGWFNVNADGLTVTIRTDAEEDQGHPYRFIIKNENGMTLVSVSTLPGEYYGDWENDLEALFKAARSQALGIDAALKGLTDRLGLPPLPRRAEDDIPF